MIINIVKFYIPCASICPPTGFFGSATKEIPAEGSEHIYIHYNRYLNNKILMNYYMFFNFYIKKKFFYINFI